MRITAEFPDGEGFFKSTPEDRSNTLAALQKAGIRLVVGTDPSLIQIGESDWQPIPKAPNYFAVILNGKSKNSINP